MNTSGMDMMEREFQDRLAAVTAERDKLQRFKDYVHARLDAAGVPVDPESSHRAEGCRIGGRLDIVLASFLAVALCVAVGPLTQEQFDNALAYVTKHQFATPPGEQAKGGEA